MIGQHLPNVKLKKLEMIGREDGFDRSTNSDEALDKARDSPRNRFQLILNVNSSSLSFQVPRLTHHK
jgi:hypothetical protein